MAQFTNGARSGGSATGDAGGGIRPDGVVREQATNEKPGLLGPGGDMAARIESGQRSVL